MKKKVIVAVTGASGAIYAKLLIDKLVSLKEQADEINIVFSKIAREVWQHELGYQDLNNIVFKIYEPDDFNAPLGSAGFNTMIICPGSMGTMGRIAAGISNDLISRAADVMLKERQKLIIVPRELPYNLIHINNMKSLTEAGAIICPASPSFYSRPASIEELAATVVDRVLILAGFRVRSFRWGE